MKNSKAIGAALFIALTFAATQLTGCTRDPGQDNAKDRMDDGEHTTVGGGGTYNSNDPSRMSGKQSEKDNPPPSPTAPVTPVPGDVKDGP